MQLHNKIISIILKANNEKDRNVKRNIIGSLIIKGLNIIVQLLLVPLTLHYLDASIYGVWLTVSSIVLWLSFFDIGFSLGLKNKLAEALANNDFIRGKKLVSTTYVTLTLIFLPICLLFEFVIPTLDLSKLLNVPLYFNEELSLVFQILVLCVCIQMVVGTICSVLQAFQKVALSNSFSVIGNVLAIIVVYVLTKTTEPSMVYLALTVSYLPVIVMIVSSIYFFRTSLKKISPSLSSVDFKLNHELFGLGIKFFIIQIQVLVLYQSTNILISNISSPTEVTEYNIAYKYISTALMILNMILGPLWPAFTDAYTLRDFDWMNGIYKKMEKLFGGIVLLIILMCLCSPIVYKLWIGESVYIQWSMTIMISLYIIINCWLAIQINLINGIGSVKLQSIITTLGMFLHIPLSFLIGHFIGCLGVVVSMIILNVVYSFFFTKQIKLLLNNKASGIWLE